MRQRRLPLEYDDKNPPSSVQRCLDYYSKHTKHLQQLLKPIEVKVKAKVEVTIYIAASSRNGKCAWSCVLVCGDKKRRLSGLEKGVDATRMYVQAAIEGLSALKQSSKVKVVTQSEYVQKGASEWMARWKKTNKKVAHQDLWDKLERLLNAHEVTWQWVGDHEGPRETVEAKSLAREAVQSGSICI